MLVRPRDHRTNADYVNNCLLRPNDDSEAYMEIVQMGEAIIAWDESRRITDVRLQA